MEKYSVLMSLYKKEKPDFFSVAIESILNQTIRPDEIIVVKDGPLTQALDVRLDFYCNKYPKLIHVVVNEANLGLGESLNRGVKVCRNELIARMDTDDIFVLNRCELQLLYMQKHKEVSIVGGQIEEFFDNENNTVGKRIVPTENAKIKQYLKKRCPFNHMTVMFRKNDVLEAGNYQDWFWNEDYYLWVRMALKGKVFANINEVLVKVRVGEEMYKRRGGLKYFKSEYNLQKYLLKNKVISIPIFVSNVVKRLVLQVLLPNAIRGWVFRKFARSN